MVLDNQYYESELVLFSYDYDRTIWEAVDLRYGTILKGEYEHIYVSGDPQNDILALDIGGFDGLGFYSRSKRSWLIEPQYSGEFFTEFSCGFALVYKVYNDDPDNNDLMLVDESNQALQIDYDLMPLSGFYSGRCRVCSITTGLQGFIDTNGQIAIPLVYEDAWDFDQYGYARVWELDGNTYFIDVNGFPLVN